MLFLVERRSPDTRDGFYEAARLLLFKSGAKLVDESVAVHVERT